MEKNIIEQIQELKDKANRYENAKERYQEYRLKIKQTMEILDGVLTEINPFINSGSSKGKRKRNSKADLLMKLYDIMKTGTEITRDHIQTDWGASYNESGYIMTKLKSLNGVIQRKDGKSSVLYIQKEI